MVELNRPDSVTAPKLAPAVKVFDNTMLVASTDIPEGGVSAVLLVPFVQVLVDARALSPPRAVISPPSATSVSVAATAPVQIAIVSHAPVNAPAQLAVLA